MTSNKKAWGGRFTGEPDTIAARFTASIDIDQRLAKEDIEGSIAHVRMLEKAGIVPAADSDKIVQGLEQIAADIAAGKMQWDPDDEDVHMNIEAELARRIGDVAGKLHTARSRNDQVATDMRLWVRNACDETMTRIDALLTALADRASEHIDVLMPGYTHVQRAQPVRLSHHLLAWCAMLERDHGRLADAKRRLNESPLGAGALAATGFAIDRNATSTALGFDRPMGNSLDAVSDRDFLVETVAALANLAVHLSRFSEELVLWSSQEFGFVTLGDGFTTGSSMMPQKKNPDVPELVRGKCGAVVGNLVALLLILKGLPLSYNRDLQEDKKPTFDAFDSVRGSLEVFAAAMRAATFNADAMRAALANGFLEATELADFLAGKGVPFREAHQLVGKLVSSCVAANKRLTGLSIDELRAVHPAFDKGAFDVMDPEHAIERRNVIGGPARVQVEGQIVALRERLRARA